MESKIEKLINSYFLADRFTLKNLVSCFQLRFDSSSRVYTPLSHSQIFNIFLSFDLVEPFQICSCNKVYSYLTSKSQGCHELYSNSISEYKNNVLAGRGFIFSNYFFFLLVCSVVIRLIFSLFFISFN